MPTLASLRCRVFGISPAETSFSRRGFSAAEPEVQQHLETAGRAFVDGYNFAIADPQVEPLIEHLERIDPMFRGFGFEGAAMGLALLDLVVPWKRGRWQRLLDSAQGNSHWYMLHVGAGWAVARVPWARRRFERVMRRFHPLYRWLLLDGYGFHQGFFYTRHYVEEKRRPAALSASAARVFDQGLGRSFWFSHGGDPESIGRTIAAFPTDRRCDLWSGVGLAAGYAGGVDRPVLEGLRGQSAESVPHLAQGAAFAAKARLRAGNPTRHTELAGDVFCRMPAERAAAVTDECLLDLPPDAAEPSYQVWRSRISSRFSLADAASHTTIGAQVSGVEFQVSAGDI